MDRLAAELAGTKQIAVDVEADSMYHFTEKVCLLQVSTGKSTYIIDPLQDIDLSGLKPVFSNPGIIKIFHGADYDIRSLYRDFQIEVCPLFDTHLACRFLGFKETGLEAVLGNLFDVSLDKRFQKKDWSKRPLPTEMIAYAASDSIYLLPLARQLKKELKALNRLYWVKEECELLSQVRPAPANHQPLFISFKGAGALHPGDLAILEALLQLRRKTAIQKDRPPFKIFQNTTINKLVRTRPTTLSKLKKTNALSKTQFEMYGHAIVDTIGQAVNAKAADLPRYPRKKPRAIRGSAQNRIKILRQWKDEKATSLDLDPALILTKAQITDLAVKLPKTVKELKNSNIIKRWQAREFGKEIIDVLNPKKE